MNNDVLHRIEQSKRVYDKQAQKAAPLTRKSAFLEGRERVLELIGDHYRSDGRTERFFADYFDQKKVPDDRYYSYKVSCYCWESFCDRWAISSKWDGELTSLEKHIDSAIKLSG